MAAQPEYSQRIAALEAERKHMATKADIADLRTDLEKLRSVVIGIQVEMRTLRWVLTLAVPSAIALTGIVVGIIVQLINHS